jgi:hypothetical protein
MARALEIYCQSFLLQGATPIVAGELVKRYLNRFSEYDGAVDRGKLFVVAGDAVENCYGVVKRDLGTTTDMLLFIGLFVRVLTETTTSLLRRHRAAVKSAGY